MASEQEHLDWLFLPAFSVRGEVLEYVNAPGARLLGIDGEAARGRKMLDLVRELVVAEDEPLLRHLSVGRQRGLAPPSSFSFRVRGVRGLPPTTVQIRASPPREDGTVTYVMNEAASEWSARTLAFALTAAAERFVSARNEAEVLERAADVLAEFGFGVMILLLEGSELVQGPIRQRPPLIEEIDRLRGSPIIGARVPRTDIPHLDEMFRARRAHYVEDTHAVVDSLHPPEVAELIKSTLHKQSMDAPIFVEDLPYAAVCAQANEISPADAGALELFARQTGAAIENVRHHRRADERLEEVQRLQRELVASERLAALGEASAAVAHEVRNPLGTIFNAAALLRREQVSEAGAAALAMLEEEAGRIDELVHNLLDLARPLEPRAVPTDVRALLQTLLATTGTRYPGKVRLELQAAGLPPKVSVDGTLISLAVDNLLRNAVQASPPDGRVTVVADVKDGDLLVRVTDEGPGIGGELASRIFQPFFTTRATGVGLGLALVARVAQAHGGTVVSEERAAGASFLLRVPLLRD